ncbi:hypothetical protein [Achromobacter insuavis]|uniref:hypothetical protein n=1 Tax=Achromobacter insuavis TaxID=1287735 RepID=UPI0015D26606|nr:hypothetical protein [Achromobacter insuavis]
MFVVEAMALMLANVGDAPAAAASGNVRVLEVIVAVGTVASAVVAAWLGLREVLIRHSERATRQTLAQATLWPEFRKYLAAIERLQQKPEKREVSVSVLVGRLEVHQWVRDAARDLSGRDLDEAAAILGGLQHACRHLKDGVDIGRDYPDGQTEKTKSISQALVKARNRIVPLVKKWRVQ